MSVLASRVQSSAISDVLAGNGASPVKSAQRSPEVSIIIVNWRSREYVRACLESIAQTSGRDSYEVLVVDNDSRDGCGTMLEEEFPQARYIESTTNLGFARANNLAVAESSGRYILFLNPDTEVCAGAIEALVAALDAQPEAGMVGARLLNTDRTLQTTCVTAVPNILNQTLNLGWLRAAFPMWGIWGMRALYRAGRIPSAVEAISGACMMVRREVVEQIGGFSTDYFMYAEDMDLCVKVARAGQVILYVPEAEIVHHGGGSSSRRQESHFSSIVTRESLMHFFAFHRGRGYARAWRIFMALVCGVRLAALALASPMVLHPRWARPLREAWTKWTGILAWCVGRVGFRRQMIDRE
jgi:N-acetylglucosaminyl-diphospho-decaprenol L-rhamnosyltransferase